MADVLETRILDGYGGRAINYLYEWAQRTGHVDTVEEYEVHIREDRATGQLLGDVVHKEVEPDPDPAPEATVESDWEQVSETEPESESEPEFEPEPESNVAKRKRK